MRSTTKHFIQKKTIWVSCSIVVWVFWVCQLQAWACRDVAVLSSGVQVLVPKASREILGIATTVRNRYTTFVPKIEWKFWVSSLWRGRQHLLVDLFNFFETLEAGTTLSNFSSSLPDE